MIEVIPPMIKIKIANKRKGFTLTEVIASIAILSILTVAISVLFSHLQRSGTVVNKASKCNPREYLSQLNKGSWQGLYKGHI